VCILGGCYRQVERDAAGRAGIGCGVIAGTTIDNVVAGAAADQVITVAATDQVITAPP
jgi:hypothetical protein